MSVSVEKKGLRYRKASLMQGDEESKFRLSDVSWKLFPGSSTVAADDEAGWPSMSRDVENMYSS